MLPLGFTQPMDNEALVRLEWLRYYCKKLGLVGDDGAPSPTKLAERTGKKVAYCSDLLRGKKKSFGPSVARQIERSLGLAKWDLEGGAGWPFPGIERAHWDALSRDQQIEIQGVVRERIDRFGRSTPRQAANDTRYAGPERRTSQRPFERERRTPPHDYGKGDAD